MADRRSLEILGDGKQSKEYLYVSDCVEGVLAGYHRAKNSVNTFNLAVEENLTVDEVAAIVMREMGLDCLELRHTGGKRGWVGDNPVVHLSIEKMKALGWRPKVPPSDAVSLTARWTREHLEGQKPGSVYV
jgi:UDP-glucose 4-epimerase